MNKLTVLMLGILALAGRADAAVILGSYYEDRGVGTCQNNSCILTFGGAPVNRRVVNRGLDCNLRVASQEAQVIYLQIGSDLNRINTLNPYQLSSFNFNFVYVVHYDTPFVYGDAGFKLTYVPLYVTSEGPGQSVSFQCSIVGELVPK